MAVTTITYPFAKKPATPSNITYPFGKKYVPMVTLIKNGKSIRIPSPR